MSFDKNIEKTRIDLEWAKQKIPGFEKLMREVLEVKASELEYKQKYNRGQS